MFNLSLIIQYVLVFLISGAYFKGWIGDGLKLLGKGLGAVAQRLFRFFTQSLPEFFRRATIQSDSIDQVRTNTYWATRHDATTNHLLKVQTMISAEDQDWVKNHFDENVEAFQYQHGKSLRPRSRVLEFFGLEDTEPTEAERLHLLTTTVNLILREPLARFQEKLVKNLVASYLPILPSIFPPGAADTDLLVTLSVVEAKIRGVLIPSLDTMAEAMALSWVVRVEKLGEGYSLAADGTRMDTISKQTTEWVEKTLIPALKLFTGTLALPTFGPEDIPLPNVEGDEDL